MDVYVTDDQIGLYFRRRQLGLRLLSHGARPQTVRTWSGLTRDQLVTLRRRWAIGEQNGRRGPSPSTFDAFFESTRTATRAALFVSLCQILGAIPSKRGQDVARKLPSLENGEMLCEALEVFKAWEPAATLTFEQAALLALGVIEEAAVRLRTCTQCAAAVVIDGYGAHHETCAHCRRHPSGRGSRIVSDLKVSRSASEQADRAKS